MAAYRRFQSRWLDPTEAKHATNVKLFARGDKLICVIAQGMRPPADGRQWKREGKSVYNTVIYWAPKDK